MIVFVRRMRVVFFRYVKSLYLLRLIFRYFFFNDTATTEIYTLSLHDALPILCLARSSRTGLDMSHILFMVEILLLNKIDRKSGSAGMPRPISYAVFCLKKNVNHKPCFA